MNTINTLRHAFLVFMILILSHGERSLHAQDKKEKKPNIIFILADDLGYNDLGCYGQELIKTPNLDRMAEEGIRFTQHYAGSTVCAPSRGVLMTGLHTGHAYIRGNYAYDTEGNLPIPDETVTVAELLKENGYATAVIGKWGLGGPGSSGGPNKQGFDYSFCYLDQRNAHEYYPPYLWKNEKKYLLEGNQGGKKEQYSHDLFTSEALGFIQVQAEKDSPFFLYLPYTIPHGKYQVPEDAPYGNELWPQHIKNYAAMITRMDKDIGRILDLLKKEGSDENTIILFSSDNCPTGSVKKKFNSNGPLRGLKQDLYEGGIRVPLIVRWPGRIQASSVNDHVSAFQDFLPTACGLAGIQAPDEIDGISYLPSLLGKKQKQHDYLYWEFFSYNYNWDQGEKKKPRNTFNKQAVRMKEWKAVRNDLSGNPDAPLELYNLDNDIGETQNVAAQHPEIVKEIKQYMEGDRFDVEYFSKERKQME